MARLNEPAKIMDLIFLQVCAAGKELESVLQGQNGPLPQDPSTRLRKPLGIGDCVHWVRFPWVLLAVPTGNPSLSLPKAHR